MERSPTEVDRKPTFPDNTAVNTSRPLFTEDTNRETSYQKDDRNTDTSQAERLLFLMHRMRQIQESQSPPHPSDSLFQLTSDTSSLFRPNYSDQPLDFSAAKKIKREDGSWEATGGQKDAGGWEVRRKQDSGLGSSTDGHISSDTGHSDLSIHSMHSLHSTHSPPLSIDSPRDGGLATTPSSLPLPRLSISPPPSTPSPPVQDSKEGLLTTAKSPGNLFLAAASGGSTQLTDPGLHHPHDMTGLLKLAGIANTMPPLHHNPFPLPFLHKPAFPPPLSSSSPLPLPTGFPPNPESMTEMAKINATSNQKYTEFRDTMLKTIDPNKTGGAKSGRRTTPDPGSPAASSTPTTEAGAACSRLTKDDAYWERRRKNNEAAKRSRDARRQKETEIALRAQYLEQENIQLKLELVQIKTQLGSLREQMNRRQHITAI